MKKSFFVFLQCAEAWFLYFVGRPQAFSSSGLDFSLSLILPYPVRNSLPFSSLRSVTVGSGRDFLEGQAHGLLELAVDPEPVVAKVEVHADAATAEVQVVRVVAALWVSS